MIIAAENARGEHGVLGSDEPWYVDDFGHPYYEGAGRYLSELVGRRLGVRVRYEKPGAIQRSLAETVSRTDALEAEMAGRAAVMYAEDGATDVMVTLEREPGDRVRLPHRHGAAIGGRGRSQDAASNHVRGEVLDAYGRLRGLRGAAHWRAAAPARAHWIYRVETDTLQLPSKSYTIGRRCAMAGNMRLWIGLAVVVVIAGGAFAWWLLAPLFFDTEVQEEFPFAANAEMPAGVTMAEAEKVMATMAKVDLPMTEPMMEPMKEAEALKTGQFMGADSFHKGEGTATVYRLPDGSGVLRMEEFKGTNGPDLRVILTPHPDPGSRDDVHQDGYVELGKLKGNIGNQNYEIPAETDLDSVGRRGHLLQAVPGDLQHRAAPVGHVLQ